MGGDGILGSMGKGILQDDGIDHETIRCSLVMPRSIHKTECKIWVEVELRFPLYVQPGRSGVERPALSSITLSQ